jgi:hypothetical protein
MLSSNDIQSNNHAPTQTLPHSHCHCHNGFNWIYFLILQFFILTFFLFLSPFYLLLRFLLELLKLGTRRYKCSRGMSDRLYLLFSHFTVQYEFIKSYGYVKVAVTLAKRLTRSWKELLSGRFWEFLTHSKFFIRYLTCWKKEHCPHWFLLSCNQLCSLPRPTYRPIMLDIFHYLWYIMH